MNKENRPGRLVLIGAPPGCGKTYYARLLAGALSNTVLLDLDTLNSLSSKLCALCGEEFDKGGDFFRSNVRDSEYETLMGFAFAALEFNSTVIVSAPFTKEFRHPEMMSEIARRAESMGAVLHPVWVLSSPEACRENMIQRGVSRDKWKLADLDGYIAGIDMSVPEGIEGLHVIVARRRGSETANLDALLKSLG